MRPAWLIVALSLSCTSSKGTSNAPMPTPAPMLTAADSAHCASVRDSVAFRPIADLPDVRDKVTGLPRPRNPSPNIRTLAFVRSDGTVDTASVRVTGTDDRQYVRDMKRYLSHTRFTPPVVSECAVAGKFDLVQTGRSEKVPFAVRRRP